MDSEHVRIYRETIGMWAHYGAIVLLFLPLPTFVISFYFVWTKSHQNAQLEFKMLYFILILICLVGHIYFFSVNIFFIPPYFIAFASMGIAATLIPISLQYPLICLFYFYSMGVNVCLVYFRMDTMLPRQHVLKKHNYKILFYLALFLLLSFCLPAEYVWGAYYQEESRQWALQTFGRGSGILDFNSISISFVIYPIDFKNPAFIRTLTLLLFTIFAAIFFITLLFIFTFKTYLAMRKIVSKKTADVHKMLLIVLIAQLTVQFICMVQVLVISGFLLLFRNMTQEIYMIDMWISYLNGFACVMVMLLTNKGYRRALIDMLLMKNGKQSQENSEKQLSVSLDKIRRKSMPVNIIG